MDIGFRSARALMFAVVVEGDEAATATGGLGAQAHVVQASPRQPRVVFVGTPASGERSDTEATGIVQLAGRFWLAGRIRLDARPALRDRLAQRTGREHRGDSDALLCLHAYATWGEAFVEQLAGDFCFALWDGEQRRLIAARDRLGVRPLFHARAGDALLVSDSLAWIVERLAPLSDLDECWIADFLCLGYSLDADRTVYRHVSRLPPAHVLAFAEGEPEVRRYWRLAIDEPIRLGGRAAYVERFLDLTAQAIRDRLPDGRVGISMSGGLDSTTLAACTVQATGDPARVVAECLHYETAMADEEKHFSTLVARHLGIELRLRAADDLPYDPAWRTRPWTLSEPSLSIIRLEPDRRVAHEQAALAGVWFYGEGPDNALVYERDAFLAWLLERRDWRRLAEAALLSLVAKGADDWGQTLARLSGRRAVASEAATVPPWLDRGLVERLKLKQRYDDTSAGLEPHPWHPRAMASFNDAIWPSLLEEFDFDPVQSPILWRHPFLELRVLEFMLSVPPVPWARRKLLLRRAMRGRLPRAVLDRRKAPLAQSPLIAPLRRFGLPDLSPGRHLDGYVDVRALPALAACPADDLGRLLAVQALDHWLATERAGR